MKTHQDDALDDIELRVAGGSQASKVAGALVKYLVEQKNVTLLAMGAGAVNQMIKAVAIARGMGATHGWDLKVIPCFADEVADGSRKTAIRLVVVKR
jgi:stage V sporulation protein S